MKKFMLQLFRTVVTLVILVVMALTIFDLRKQLAETRTQLAEQPAPTPAVAEPDGHDAGL